MTADEARQQLIDVAHGNSRGWAIAHEQGTLAEFVVAAILDPAHRELVLTALGDRYEQVGWGFPHKGALGALHLHIGQPLSAHRDCEPVYRKVSDDNEGTDR